VIIDDIVIMTKSGEMMSPEWIAKTFVGKNIIPCGLL